MSDYINQDFIFSILKFSPVKSLLRFRCVCKSWKEVIDSRYFILAHLSVQRPQMLLKNFEDEFIHLDPQSFPPFYNLTSPDWDPNSNVIEGSRWSYRDSVICTVDGVISVMFPFKHLLVLWNPSIRRKLHLPLPKFSNSSVDYFSSCGFWIDPCTGSFKVVIFCFSRDKVAVFSSEKQAWTQVSIEPFNIKNYRIASNFPQILVDGVCHWLACDPHTESPQRWAIVSFDFCKDKFRSSKLPLPEQGKLYACTYPNIVRWKGFVSVAYWEHVIPFRCDLWAMQSGTWNKMLSFNLSPDICYLFHVVEDNCRVLVAGNGERLKLYDYKDDSFIYLPTNAQLRNFYASAYGFVESFIVPDEISVKLITGLCF